MKRADYERACVSMFLAMQERADQDEPARRQRTLAEMSPREVARYLAEQDAERELHTTWLDRSERTENGPESLADVEHYMPPDGRVPAKRLVGLAGLFWISLNRIAGDAGEAKRHEQAIVSDVARVRESPWDVSEIVHRAIFGYLDRLGCVPSLVIREHCFGLDESPSHHPTRGPDRRPRARPSRGHVQVVRPSKADRARAKEVELKEAIIDALRSEPTGRLSENAIRKRLHPVARDRLHRALLTLMEGTVPFIQKRGTERNPSYSVARDGYPSFVPENGSGDQERKEQSDAQHS